ncbi:hypothetical protein FA15DRAFT_327613 [Coprinopsis marcescibilis]|uniref:F-box domain-containing protein n=1 Tax=Coprinopsis marcescibilis TaxID=230819 RepID=A0A5C3KYM4_COPMA|nr:hypothetical protein FA15DRAFT_327613 [Coprinopsis marcescibilis]
MKIDPSPRFPLEIWGLVLRQATLNTNLQFLENTDSRLRWKTKRNVVLVCKGWNVIAARFLCEHVSMTGLTAFNKFFDVFLQDKSARFERYTVRLDIPLETSQTSKRQQSRASLFFDRLQIVLKGLPNLTVLCLSKSMQVDTQKWINILRDHSNLRAFGSPSLIGPREPPVHPQLHLPNLQLLRITCPSHSMLYAQLPSTSFPKLRHLDLTVAGSISDIPFLQVHGRNLTTLHFFFNHPYYLPKKFGKGLQTLCPNLRELFADDLQRKFSHKLVQVLGIYLPLHLKKNQVSRFFGGLMGLKSNFPNLKVFRVLSSMDIRSQSNRTYIIQFGVNRCKGIGVMIEDCDGQVMYAPPGW